MTVETLLDCEGSSATVHEAFPAVDSDERWVLPINCVLGAQGGHNVVDRLHTPGHMSVGPEPSLCVAVVHGLQIADPDVVYVSDHDSDRAAATRRRFLGELADEGAEVIVSHFHGRGRFERSGKGFRWAVE